MDVNAGKLNKRVEIVRSTTTQDADGYVTPTETVIRRPWAQFSRVSGTEALRQGADMGDVKARFLIRSSHTAISRKDRVRYNGADYEIEYVNDYGDSGAYTELIARKLTAGG